MHNSVVTQLVGDRKRQHVVIQRRALFKALSAVACVLVTLVGGLALAGWEVQVLHSTQAADRRSATGIMHHNSVALVRAVMELQSEVMPPRPSALPSGRMYQTSLPCAYPPLPTCPAGLTRGPRSSHTSALPETGA